jgi:hypothetical protein
MGFGEESLESKIFLQIGRFGWVIVFNRRASFIA